VVRRQTVLYNRASESEGIVPELPEVETVVRDLRPRVTRRRIVSVRAGVRSLRRPWSADWSKLVSGRRVQALRRRGKWILVDLEGQLCLVIHLGMTGRLTVTPADAPLAPHTHLIFELDRKPRGESSNPGVRRLTPGLVDTHLRFNDIRRFGSATLFTNRADLDGFFENSRLGPEPFDLDPAYWRDCLAATNRCLKAVLLDQRVVAGIGNIYADESLFQARLHPARLGRSTTAAEATSLRRALITVLTRAIERRGSSIRNYVGGSGLKGRYQNEFRVYGRAGAPCPRCRSPIERIRLAGRSTHYCPRCQRSS
jgi:formamidopyrimidine-DNA glycosylase